MKINLNEKDSKIIKENETYTLIDNTDLNGLIVSKTILHPLKETGGHNHEGQEEVYQFVSGKGTMVVGSEEDLLRRGIDMQFSVSPGDIILIPDGDFHKVWNTSKYEDLIFVCVFDGGRNH